MLPSCSSWLALLLALALPLRAEDWPQWRGPARTGQVAAGSRVPTRLAPDPKIVWKLPAGEGFASPIVADGRVFLFDNQAGQETLRALRSADGHELWRATVDATFQDEQGPPGPRCTPLVEGDRVYAQSGQGELQCLRAADGQRLWRANYRRDFGAAFLGEDSKVPGAAEHGYTASPVIAGPRLIVCAGGTNGAGVVCFEKRTGAVQWKSQDDLAAYAAPIIATLAGVEQAVCFTVEGLIGLDLDDGRCLWRVPLKTSYGRNCTTPVVVENWVIVGSYRAGLMGVKISAEGAGLKGERAWINKAAAMNFSSPVAVGHHLYGLGPAKNLFCLEAETGRVVWSKDGYFTTSADVAYGALVVLGKNLLLCTDGGQLALLAATPVGCADLGRAQVCGLNWCSPAYADGRLYVRDGLKTTGRLYCIELVNGP